MFCNGCNDTCLTPPGHTLISLKIHHNYNKLKRMQKVKFKNRRAFPPICYVFLQTMECNISNFLWLYTLVGLESWA